MNEKRSDQELSLRAYSSTFTKEMEEMLVIQSELKACIRGVEIWAEKFAGPHDVVDDRAIIGASLYRDAIVQFVGCFSNEERYKLRSTEVYRNYKGGQEFFNWLKDLRDCYAAHSFGAWRQAFVGILFDTAQSKIFGVGWVVGKFAGTEREGAPELIKFMSVAKRHVDDIVDRFSKQLEAEIVTISNEKAASLRPVELRTLHPKEARLSRSQFKAKSGKS